MTARKFIELNLATMGFCLEIFWFQIPATPQVIIGNASQERCFLLWLAVSGRESLFSTRFVTTVLASVIIGSGSFLFAVLSILMRSLRSQRNPIREEFVYRKGNFVLEKRWIATFVD